MIKFRILLALSLFRRGPGYVLFPDHIGATFFAHPDLMDSASLNIDSITNAICFLLCVLFFWVDNCEFALEDQMGSETSVRVRAVVGIAVEKQSASFWLIVGL
jgi:hypothetical protein